MVVDTIIAMATFRQGLIMVIVTAIADRTIVISTITTTTETEVITATTIIHTRTEAVHAMITTAGEGEAEDE
jgi:hypothetical protein